MRDELLTAYIGAEAALEVLDGTLERFAHRVGVDADAPLFSLNDMRTIIQTARDGAKELQTCPT